MTVMTIVTIGMITVTNDENVYGSVAKDLKGKSSGGEDGDNIGNKDNDSDDGGKQGS